ncbi:hypothetical protein ALC62_03851, partial [Cyphomyrmex costatus]
KYILTEEINKEKNADKFWAKLLNFKNILNEHEYFNISSFALNVLSIPHSNAECERIFSKVNLIKTKSRNRLATKTINGILLTAQCVKQNNSCVKFVSDIKMINAININMYDHHKQDVCNKVDDDRRNLNTINTYKR